MDVRTVLVIVAVVVVVVILLILTLRRLFPSPSPTPTPTPMTPSPSPPLTSLTPPPSATPPPSTSPVPLTGYTCQGAVCAQITGAQWVPNTLSNSQALSLGLDLYNITFTGSVCWLNYYSSIPITVNVYDANGTQIGQAVGQTISQFSNDGYSCMNIGPNTQFPVSGTPKISSPLNQFTVTFSTYYGSPSVIVQAPSPPPNIQPSTTASLSV